jgi:geranylgeranyl transferase type-2 subunit alpha
VLECRRLGRHDPPALAAAAKLLKVVPEIYTVWNYRREALAPAFEGGGEGAQAASDGELALTQVRGWGRSLRADKESGGSGGGRE